MPSTFLKIIPTNPSYVPDEMAQEEGRVILSKLYKPSEIEFHNTSEIEFIDQGSNFENVSCNLCQQEIDMEYWQSTMDKSFETQFSNLIFVTPCCSCNTSLNDLNYTSPAGFAKYVICIGNPERELEGMILQHLQTILGTPLRFVWAHY
jgi:hypothetical protein